MRALFFLVPLALAGCGPSNSCPNATVGAVSVTIDGVKDPTGAGECASGTNSNVVIVIGGPQHLSVSLGIGADATGTHECKDGLVSVQLDGDSAPFKPTALFSNTNFQAGSAIAGDQSCTVSFSGIPPSGKASGTITARLSKPVSTDSSAATTFIYADLNLAFSFTP